MTERTPSDTILLPIDLHGVSRSTLDTLVRLARHLDCGLLGLFVEDPRLQQVADLPFPTEIVLSSGGERELRPERLRSRLGRVSRDTRTWLDELAGHNKVQLTYETASGARLNAVLQRAGGEDIFIPGRVRRPSAPGRGAPRAVIPRLGVLLGEPEGDDRALSIVGVLVAAGLVGVLHVLVTGAVDAGRLQAIERLGRRPHLLRLQDRSPQGIIELIRRAPYDLQILPLSSLRDIPPAQLEAALDTSRSQVLVVS